MLKRLFDIVFTLFGVILLLPVGLVIALVIPLDSKGPSFYLQERIGLRGKPFKLIKFRTMYTNSGAGSLITIGNSDSRITRFGRILRKYKLDELPQMLNILYGQMSLVGPRPEVKKYVSLYSENQKQVLKIKPGLTDYASLKFIDENQLLSEVDDPEHYYITEIMPQKLRLNLTYLQHRSLWIDIKIILQTFRRLIR